MYKFIQLFSILVIFVGCTQQHEPEKSRTTINRTEALKLNKLAMDIVTRTLNSPNRIDSLNLALKYLDDAIKMDSLEFVLFANKANLECEMKKYNNAIRTFDILIKLKDSSATILASQGFLYERIGENELANKNYLLSYEKFNKQIRQDPKNIKLHLGKVFIMLFLNDKSIVMDSINNIISNYPNNNESLTMRSTISNFNRHDYLFELFP